MNSETKRILIAIGYDPTKKQVWKDHFGMAPQYHLFDFTGSLVETRENPNNPDGNNQKHHGNPKKITELLAECSVFIAQQFGNEKKRTILEDAGIQLAITKEIDAQAAIDNFISNRSAS